MTSLKIAAATAFLSLPVILPAQALDATDTWRGSIIVTAETAACDVSGMPQVGQTLLAVLRPNITESDPPTGVLITFNNGALLITALDPPPNGRYTGDLIGGLATYQNYTGGTFTSLKVKPNPIAPSRPQVTVSGKFTKFRNIAGCTVTVKGSFFKGVVAP